MLLIELKTKLFLFFAQRSQIFNVWINWDQLRMHFTGLVVFENHLAHRIVLNGAENVCEFERPIGNVVSDTIVETHLLDWNDPWFFSSDGWRNSCVYILSFLVSIVFSTTCFSDCEILIFVLKDCRRFADSINQPFNNIFLVQCVQTFGSEFWSFSEIFGQNRNFPTISIF